MYISITPIGAELLENFMGFRMKRNERQSANELLTCESEGVNEGGAKGGIRNDDGHKLPPNWERTPYSSAIC